MKRILKYRLSTGLNQITLPKDSKVLDVQVQHGEPCMWVLTYTEYDKTEERIFEFYGTGHEIDESSNRNYIGTFQMHGGNLVFHLFELV